MIMFNRTRMRISNLARWESSTLKMLGNVELVLGLMLFVPSAVALIYGEDPTIFLIFSPFLLIPGIVQSILFYSDGKLAPSAGLLIMCIAWAVAFVMFAMPYYLYGFSWVDSMFEAISGFTTTGSSIVSDVESLPYSLLFWRSFSQWLGGIAVVLVFMFLLPMMGIGGRVFLNNELAGSDRANFYVKLKSVATSFIFIYMVFTIMEVLLLTVAGVIPFESVCMTMSNISTGGLMVKGDSIASYSFAVQAIVLVFMFLGGTNFYLHYRTLYKREWSAYVKSREFIGTFFWFIAAAVLIALAVIGVTDGGSVTLGESGKTFWEALFSVVSIGTSTGYSIADFSAWPAVTAVILWFCGMFGAMSGSTAGGIKMYRVILLLDYLKQGFYKMMHPKTVKEIKFDGNTVNADSMMSVIVVMLSFLFVSIFAVVAFMFLEPKIDVIDSLGLTMASIGNVGLALGQFGPSGNMSELCAASKILMSSLMWVGRLEVFMVLLLFTKTFWKDLALSTNHSGKANDTRSYMKFAGNKRR